MLQIVVRTKVVVYRIDDVTGPEEVNFIDDFHKLVQPNTFVNCGVVHSYVQKKKDKAKLPEFNTIHLNGTANMYMYEYQAYEEVRFMMGKTNNTLVAKNTLQNK